MRETDIEVAEKVMGLTVERDYPVGYYPDGCDFNVPDTPEEANHWHCERQPIYRIDHGDRWREGKVVPFYSTEIAAAWTVVERLIALGYSPDLIHSGRWRCEVDRFTPPDAEHDPFPITAIDSSAPLAICRAALAAVATPTPEERPDGQ